VSCLALHLIEACEPLVFFSTGFLVLLCIWPVSKSSSPLCTKSAGETELVCTLARADCQPTMAEKSHRKSADQHGGGRGEEHTMSLVVIIVFSGCSGYFNFLNSNCSGHPNSRTHCTRPYLITRALSHTPTAQKTLARAHPRSHARTHGYMPATRKRKYAMKGNEHTRHSLIITHSLVPLVQLTERSGKGTTDRSAKAKRKRQRERRAEPSHRDRWLGGKPANKVPTAPRNLAFTVGLGVFAPFLLLRFFFLLHLHMRSRLPGSGPQVACCATSLSHRHVSAIVSCQPCARAASLLFANVAHVVRAPRRCTHCRSRSGSRERCCACCRAHALERAPHPSTLRQGVRVCTPGARVKILDVFHFLYIQHVPRTHTLVVANHGQVLLWGIFLLHQPPPPLHSFHGGHPPRAGCCAASSSRAPRGKVLGDHLTIRG
jgi:hypothetical protein